MAFDSDPDYNPEESSEESEGSNDDIEDGQLFPKPGTSNSAKKRFIAKTKNVTRSEMDISFTILKLEQKPNKENVSLRSSQSSERIVKSQSAVYMYHCSFCYYQTLHRYYLKLHFKSCKQSSSKKLWGCPRCSGKYTLNALLDEHTIPADQESVDNHVFYCPICPLEDETSEATVLEKTHPSNRNMVCPRCKVKINGINTLRQHLITEHDVSIMYRCEYCEYHADRSESLLVHKKKHTSLNEMGLIECSHCHFDFFTMDEFKDHMKKVQAQKKLKEADQKDKGMDAAKNDFESSVSSEAHEEKVNLDADFRNTADIGKWQLHCTLCEYVNYSKISCRRHVKNKHRPFGHSVVKFNKYYENELKGTIDIGRVKVSEDEKQSTKELLKVLDWTQSDEEDISETPVQVTGNEIITIEVASDTEDENEDHLNNSNLEREQNKDKSGESIKYKNKVPEIRIKQEIIDEAQDENEDNLNNTNLEREQNKEKSAESIKYKNKVTEICIKQEIIDETPEKTELDCKDCSYRAQNSEHLSIHKQIIHKDIEEDNLFKCPIRPCNYNSTERDRLRNHITKVHKIKVDTFYPTELKCPDCIYVAKKPQHLLIHKVYAHKGQPAKKSLKQKSRSKTMTPSESKKRKTKVDSERQGVKGLKKVNQIMEIEQGDTKNSSLRCVRCKKKHNTMYQLAWHMLKSHSDKSELQKWRFRCNTCSYENSSKLKCYKHAFKHKRSQVKFLKFYKGKLKGFLGFRYLRHQKTKLQQNLITRNSLKRKSKINDGEKDNNLDSSIEKEAAEFRDSPSTRSRSIKTINMIRSDEDNEKDEASYKSDEDILLTMKAEFFACTQCSYETKNQSHLPFHHLLAHRARISSDKEKFKCRECDFESKYRHSLRRHLEGVHKYNTDDFYTKEQAETVYKKKEIQIPTEEFVKAEQLGNYDCQLCTHKCQDKYLRDWHMVGFHRKSKTELLKWRLVCTLCSYVTYSKKNAQLHATSRHGSTKKSVIVPFDRYYKNKFEGIFNFPIKTLKILHCTKCNYQTKLLEYLKDHYKSKKHKRKIKALNQAKEVESRLEKENEEEEMDVHNVVVDKEPNSSDEMEQGEIIEIQIYPDSGTEADEGSELLQQDKEFEKNTDIWDRQSNEELDFLKPSKRHKTTVYSELGDEIEHAKRFNRRNTTVHNEDEDNESEDSLRNEELSKNSKTKRNTDLPANIKYLTNKCIYPDCEYESDKSNLKQHCLQDHKYSRKKLDAIFLKLNQYECRLCKFQTPTRREISTHMIRRHEVKNDIFHCKKCKTVYKDRYQQAAHMYKVHGDKAELLKWRLRCTLCCYETHWRKYAHRHGLVLHSSTTEPTIVKFERIFRDEFEDFYTCRYKVQTLHHCNMCEFVTGTWDCLTRHIERHKRPNFVPLYQMSEKEAEVMVKRHNRVIEPDSATEENQKIKGNTESYSKEQILDIIGLEIPEEKEVEDNSEEAVDTSNEGHEENSSKVEGNNEIITIEVTSENQETETKNKKTSTLNPFTGEFIMESDDEEQLPSVEEEQAEKSREAPSDTSKGFKCNKAGCTYIADSLKEITDHIKSCKQNNFMGSGVMTTYSCHSCAEVLTHNSLLRHCNSHAVEVSNPNLVVTFTELKNDGFSCEIEVKANLDSEKARNKNVTSKDQGKISYKCWMCGVVLITKSVLKNHTYVHAREDNNFKLKVRFSRFRDEKLEGAIIMHADPNYVPRKKKVVLKPPEPEYDPSLPVFGCNECNFKTNEKEELKKHKNLHWTAEKDALFKAQKWYTCSICFFHCFDLKKFNEHCEWHKTHYTTPGNIKMMGKDSWFLK